jgi:hypothetical protein
MALNCDTTRSTMEQLVDMGVPGVSVGGAKPTGNHNKGTATCPRKQLSTTSSQPSITRMPRVTTPKQPSIMRPDNTKKPPITPTLQGDTRFMRGIIPTKLPRPTWTTMERSSRSMPSGVSSQESLGWRPLSFTRTVSAPGQIQRCSAPSVARASLIHYAEAAFALMVARMASTSRFDRTCSSGEGRGTSAARDASILARSSVGRQF